jgi:adenylosuccinate lyase
VDPSAMIANVTRANDVILGEAAVFTLAQTMSRNESEALVKGACRTAVTEGKPLITVLHELMPDVPINWMKLAAPENYLGESSKIIDRILQHAAKQFCFKS